MDDDQLFDCWDCLFDAIRDLDEEKQAKFWLAVKARSESDNPTDWIDWKILCQCYDEIDDQTSDHLAGNREVVV